MMLELGNMKTSWFDESKRLRLNNFLTDSTLAMMPSIVR